MALEVSLLLVSLLLVSLLVSLLLVSLHYTRPGGVRRPSKA